MKTENTDPIRILQIVGTLRRAGAETWLIEVLRRIDRQRFQMDFLVEAPTPGGYDAEAESLGARIIACPGFSNPPRFGWNLWRSFRRHRYDIVHSHINYHAGFSLAVAALSGVPVRIAHSHSNVSGRSLYHRAMRRAIHLFATAGVAVSPASGLSFFGSDWGFDQRWKLLTCGIDLNGYAEPKRTELRAGLEIPQDALLFGHVGRFHPDKNHHRLIAIAAAVMSWRPNTFLLLVGDGTNCAPLHKACRDAGLDGRVRILGARNDVPALLSAMDVFLFPSRSEGLGLACVEAQAAGLPVIASAKVPEQACVIPALFRRIDLASSNAVWVAAVFNSQLTPKLDPRLAVEWIGKSAFNIDRSAANLSNLYLDALSGATRPFRHPAGEVCPR